MSKTNKWIILLSILVFLVTTAGLLSFNLTYHEECCRYSGWVAIDNQKQYQDFLDVIFIDSVKVGSIEINGKVYKNIGKEELQDKYQVSMPKLVGFDFNVLDGTGNPLKSLSSIVYYTLGEGVYNVQSQSRLIFNIIIFMIGYGIAIGLWISRNGIYEVRHEVVSGNCRLQR